VTFTAIPNTLPTGYTVEYVWKNGSTQATVAGEIASTMNYVATGYGTTCFAAYAITSWSDGVNSVIGLPLTSFSSLDLIGSVCFSIVRPRPVSVVTTPTTIAPTVTTGAATTATVATTGKASMYVNAVPGITVTDPIVYRAAPKRVAENSAVLVLTRLQTRTFDVETRTPAVCLPNDNDLVFISEGSCIADVVNQRTRVVLRTLRTKVVSDNIEKLLVGNEIVTLAPIYFSRMSAHIGARGRRTLKAIRIQAKTAGSILVIGHSGIIYGNSSANQKVAADRATAVMNVLKSFGAKAPFASSSVGAIDPASTRTSEKAQGKNRRVVIALTP
jgi:outer membrane protein OmpA-like peptidoglycan-associated protein